MSETKKNILIYRIGSLGDTIIALPVFHKVKEAFPNADITLLTNRPIVSKAAPLETVLGSNYFFDRVINYPIGTRNPMVLFDLLKQIRSLKIDIVINLATTRVLGTIGKTKRAVLRDKWFFKAAGITKFFGFPSIKEDFELSIDPITNEIEWEAKRLARRLNQLGPIDLEADCYWDMRFTTDELAKASEALNIIAHNSKPIIAACAGTKMPSKDWEADNWLNLLKQLKVNFGDWNLVMVGAPEESERAERCIVAWGGAGVNLCGKTSPRVSGAILKQASVFIGHDSGPMHLAACVGTPVVAIYSARNIPRQWYPRGNFNKIIYHKTDCAGCVLEVCTVQKKKCILSITVEEVKAAVTQILIDNETLN